MNISPRVDLPLLDVLRLIASAVIVYFHMRGESVFGIAFGLPLFLVIMFGLAAGSAKREPVLDFARRKTRYLLVPWLRWSVFYLVLLGLADVARGGQFWSRLEPEMIFYGGHPSLWFLPFAALAVIPVKALQARVVRAKPVRAGLVLALLAAVATTGATCLVQRSMPEIPVRLWLRFSPAILWGLAVGQSVRVETDRERSILLTSVAVLAVISGTLSPVTESPQLLPLQFAIAVPLACLGFGVRPRVPESVRLLSSATFGIYLLHPLIGKILVAGFDVFAWQPVIHASAVWGLACLGVLALRKTRLPWQELSVARSKRGAGELRKLTPRAETSTTAEAA